jgi:hypothetical protein
MIGIYKSLHFCNCVTTIADFFFFSGGRECLIFLLLHSAQISIFTAALTHSLVEPSDGSFFCSPTASERVTQHTLIPSPNLASVVEILNCKKNLDEWARLLMMSRGTRLIAISIIGSMISERPLEMPFFNASPRLLIKRQLERIDRLDM